MPGLYTIITRALGENITPSKYNADQQQHVDNQTPQMTDDYSSNSAQMQTVTDPGELASESLPTSLAGEIERLRFMLKDIGGGAQWYSSPSQSLTALIATVALKANISYVDAADAVINAALALKASTTYVDAQIAATAATIINNKSYVVKTDGDFNTSSATFVDITGMTVNITTGARRVALTVMANVRNNAAGARTLSVNAQVDGGNLGGTGGVWRCDVGSNDISPVTFSVRSGVLTAAAHTFKLQCLSSGGSMDFLATTTLGAHMYAEELPYTT